MMDYTLEHRDASQSNWTSNLVTNNGNIIQFSNLTGLSPNTTYNWRIKCDSLWVTGPNFTTSSLFNFSFTTSDASCVGNNDGAIDLNVLGGTPPYNYNWGSSTHPSFNDTTEDINNLLSGLYYVDVTDASGFSDRDSVYISVIDSHYISQNLTNFSINPLTGYGQWTYTTLQLTNLGCDVNLRPEFVISHENLNIIQGDFDLQWLNPLTGQYANLPYNINTSGQAFGFWHYTSNGSNPDSTGIIVNQGAIQTLDVRVRFNNNPTNTANHGLYSCVWNTQEVDSIGNIIQTLAPADTLNLRFSNCNNFYIDSLSISNILCYATNDGSAYIYSLVGGLGNYSYLWSNGDTSSIAGNLFAGSYEIIITDNITSCQDSATFNILESTPTLISLFGGDISCSGYNDGFINSSISGIGTYSYGWSNGEITQNIDSLTAGQYTMTVYDSVCNTSIMDSLIINDPGIITFSTSSLPNASCDSNQCSGQISAALYGGTEPYQYYWGTGSNQQTITNLCSGTYSIIATDANSCQTFYDTIIIGDTIGTVYFNIISNNVSCYDLNDGTAEAITSQGPNFGNVSTLNYCGSSPHLSSGVNISQVNLIGENGNDILNNTSLIGDSYSDFTNLFASLNTNNTYTISLDIGTINPNPLIREYAGAKVYVDWNTDGDFLDYDEEIGIINVDTVPFVESISFTVPNTLSGYVTRLRVVMQENNDTIIGACDSTFFDPISGTFIGPFRGSTEDYSIVVNAPQQQYSYIWSNGDTTQLIDSLSPGTYSCIITDESNCTATDSIIITEPSQIIDSIFYSPILCYGGTTSASLIISGGNPPYIQNWSSDSSRITAGQISYTITDSSGCQTTNSHNIPQPIQTQVSIQIIDSISCSGANNGSLAINIVNGVPPFNLVWTNNINNDSLYTDTINNLASARYFCTVTDSNNCISTASFSLIGPTGITVTQNNTNVLCYGDTTGSTTISIAGGDSNYTLDAFGQTLPLLGANTISSTQFFPQGIFAGIYPFSVSDSSGCFINDTIIISQPDPLVVMSNVNGISCHSFADGSAYLNISGGTPPYIENWGAFNPNSLDKGIYYYSVTDSNNCIFSDSIEIVEPDSFYVQSQTDNISCFGFNDGNVTLTFVGGTPPYNENWGTSNPQALSPGVHYYSAHDTNGCSITDSVIVLEPNQIIYSITSSNVTCYGGNNGSATIFISSGDGPFSENWFGFSPQTLSAGTYQFSITDSNNCSVSDSVTIIQSQDSLNSFLNATNLTSCQASDGSIDQNIIGGIPPYTFLWNNGDTTEDISNLTAGNYQVTTIDSNGCIATSSIFVDQPSDSLRLNLNALEFNGFNISCFGDSNGTIVASTFGGYGPMLFNWSNGDTGSVTQNLNIDSYYVTVTDDSTGCSLTDSINLIGPEEFSISFLSANVSCHNDSNAHASVIYNGGIAPYSCIWDSDSTNILDSIDNLKAGSYTVIAADANGCSISDTITISEPDSLILNFLISDYNGYNISCQGGQDANVDLIILGGTSPYNISFDTSFSSYNAFVNNELDTSNIPLSSSGTYLFSITDSNGCMFTDSLILNEPTLLSSSVQKINDASCFDVCDGSMFVNANGGTSPYSFIWNNDSIITSDTVTNLCAGANSVLVIDANGCLSNSQDTINQPHEIQISLDSITNNTINGGTSGSIFITLIDTNITVQYNWVGPNGYTSTNEDISNLSAGVYILNLSDSSSCSLDTFVVSEPPSLSVSLDYVINNICWGKNQGAIAITAIGGDSTYSYSWTGPNGFSSSDEDIDSLFSGIYVLELSDSSDTIYQSYTVLENDEVIVFSSGGTALCDDGSALATANGFGGIPPLNTYWSNGDTGISTFLSVGTHAVTVIDLYGCSSTDSVTIEPGDSLSLFLNVTPVSCYGLYDGIVEVLVTNGGTAPFLFSNDSGLTYQNSNTFYNLPSGINTFNVVDINGCTNTISTNISQPLELGVDIIFTNLECYNDCNATATAIVDNGTQPYSYLWTDPNQQQNQTAINLCSGSYNVTVTDDNGCVATSLVNIINPNPIIINVLQYENYLEATYGFASYQWLDSLGNPIVGDTSNIFYPPSSGSYSVEVSDSNNCFTISYVVNYSYTGVNENYFKFEIYPNPTNGDIFISNAAKISEIEIYNSLGVKVVHYDNLYSANVLQFDISDKTRGVYFIKIKAGKKLMNYKIVLQ
tara:strand:- start:1521 stop:8069 length:6549 start_codon:yes stop_codon:yes gene_type:complete